MHNSLEFITRTNLFSNSRMNYFLGFRSSLISLFFILFLFDFTYSITALSHEKLYPIKYALREISPQENIEFEVHVIPGEFLVANISSKCKGRPLELVFYDMSGNKITSFEGLKNSRKQIQIDTDCHAIKVTVRNVSDLPVKTRVELFIKSNQILAQFDPDVKWKTIYDTLYKEIEIEKIVDIDTIYEEITISQIKVHTVGSFLSENETCVPFTLPKNTIKWSYYFEVDQSGQSAYEQGSSALAQSIKAINQFTKNPMAYFLATGFQFIPQLSGAEDVEFELLTPEDAKKFRSDAPRMAKMDFGTNVNTWKRFDTPVSGSYVLCFENANLLLPVIVDVRIDALIIEEHKVKEKKVVIDKINAHDEWYVN